MARLKKGQFHMCLQSFSGKETRNLEKSDFKRKVEGGQVTVLKKNFTSERWGGWRPAEGTGSALYRRRGERPQAKKRPVK